MEFYHPTGVPFYENSSLENWSYTTTSPPPSSSSSSSTLHTSLHKNNWSYNCLADSWNYYQQNWNSHEETPIEALQQSFHNYQPDVKSFEAILSKPRQQPSAEHSHK